MIETGVGWEGGFKVTSTKITLKNMVFYGYHGAFAAEKELGQHVEIDVEAEGDFIRAGQTDRLDLTVNYVQLYEVVKELAEKGSFNLIEALGTAIAERVLERFEIDRVTVRVRKPHPPLGGIVAASEFEIVKDK